MTYDDHVVSRQTIITGDPWSQENAKLAQYQEQMKAQDTNGIAKNVMIGKFY
jgi:hypothetical protein